MQVLGLFMGWFLSINNGIPTVKNELIASLDFAFMINCICSRKYKPVFLFLATECVMHLD